MGTGEEPRFPGEGWANAALTLSFDHQDLGPGAISPSFMTDFCAPMLKAQTWVTRFVQKVPPEFLSTIDFGWRMEVSLGTGRHGRRSQAPAAWESTSRPCGPHALPECWVCKCEHGIGHRMYKCNDGSGLALWLIDG